MILTKKAGLMTKLVILALLIYLTTALLNLRGQISTAQTNLDGLNRQVAVQTQKNAELADAVAHSDDPERVADVAREKLGLVTPGEKIFIYTK